MGVWNWLLVNCLNYQIENRNELSSVIKPKQKALEFHPLKKEERVQSQAPYLPNELVKSIFDLFAADLLNNPSLESENLKMLFQCAQVCRQWNVVAEDYFAKIYKKLMGGEEKPKEMSGAQALGLLYNWKKPESKNLLVTSKAISGEFIPLDCHKPLEHPATTFDKVKVNGMRVLLNSRYLLAFNIEDQTKAAQRAWDQKVDNPERRILVSTDSKLIATQHYYPKKDKHGNTRLVCRFDVRHLQTGQLLGSVKALCPGNEKIFDQKSVQFDFKKFVYQKEGKERTRYYDPCLVQGTKAAMNL